MKNLICEKCGKENLKEPVLHSGELYCKDCFFADDFENDFIEDCLKSGGLE